MAARPKLAAIPVAALLVLAGAPGPARPAPPAGSGGAKAPSSIRARSIRWSDEKRSMEVDITYPALAAGLRGAAEFDAFFERQARRWESRARKIAADPKVMQLAKTAGVPSTVAVSFAVALASPRYVTVVSSGSEYSAGAAHAVPFRTATTFDLERGRPLGEADLFAPGGKSGAVALVLRKLRKTGQPIDDALLARGGHKAAGDLSNWTFRADSVEVVLPVSTVAPYASGEISVRLSYDDLRPFLRSNAPLPPR